MSYCVLYIMVRTIAFSFFLRIYEKHLECLSLVSIASPKAVKPMRQLLTNVFLRKWINDTALF